MSQMDLGFALIELSIADDVAVIKLKQPEVLNAISPAMIRELLLALDEIEKTGSNVRCLLVTGEGRAFCAGADLRPGRSGGDNPGRRDAGYDLEFFYHPLLRRLRDLQIPVITAVNGSAAGVGVSLALMGDLILASKNAYFLLAFRHIGLVPDGGATWLLPRLIGRARAVELSLLGERLPAERALEWGLVTRVYPHEALMDEAVKMAGDLARGPTVALGLTRRLFWESANRSYEEQLDLERKSQFLAGQTDDFAEGVKAFSRKLPPHFTGR